MFDFSGRIGRMEFFGFQILAVVIAIIAIFMGAFFAAVGGGGGAFIGVLIMLAGILWAALVSIKAYVQRFHDFGIGGAWVLLSFVPFLGTLVFLFCLIKPGDEGMNSFDYQEIRYSTGLPPYANRSPGNQDLCVGSGSARYSSPRRGRAVCDECSAEVAMSGGRLLTHRAGVAMA